MGAMQVIEGELEVWEADILGVLQDKSLVS